MGLGDRLDQKSGYHLFRALMTTDEWPRRERMQAPCRAYRISLEQLTSTNRRRVGQSGRRGAGIGVGSVRSCAEGRFPISFRPAVSVS